MSYDAWLRANSPTYLQDPNGAAWMGGLGSAMDDYFQQYAQATLAAFPDYAPSDALGVIGDEIGFDRGPQETDAQYAARLQAAWVYWPLAGTAVGLLAAMHFAGFDNAVIVTQNGVAYQLTLPLVVGANPIANLVITSLGTNPTLGVAAVPWWTFDQNNGFTSRFAVLWWGAPAAPFLTHGRAVFTGAENGGSVPWPTVAWNNQFASTSYNVRAGVPVVTQAPSAVPLVTYDPTTQTAASVQAVASDSFVGYVDFVAWQVGANPYADLHPQDLARLQSVIKKWRPAKATCTSISVCVQGKFIGWPVRKINSGAYAGSKIGASSGVVFSAGS